MTQHTHDRIRCPLCGRDQVPHDAKFCPYCSQRLYRMAGLDDTELVTERTQGFTGREWVFEAIDAWLADPKGARVFLLRGLPGTGKTAIAAQLVRMVAGEAPAEPYPHLGPGSIRFFQFCQAFRNDTLDPLRFTKALPLQLAREYSAFADALLKAGARDPGVQVAQHVETADRSVVVGAVIQDLHIGNLSASVAFDRVVAGPLKQMPKADPPDTILILLDGLDEALTYPGETLVDLLAHAFDDPRDLPPQVRFLLTSRPDERVTHPLGQPALDLIADAPADVDDVRDYAHRRLRALDEPRRSDMADRIAKASQGNFLYARYVIDDLPPDLNQVEDLAELPLPEDLPDVYRQFLRRELGRSLDTWDDDYAPLLGAVAAARGDGMTSAQLAGVTKQRRNKMQRLLRTCGQYLAGPQPDGPFRIYHQSFRDFLLEDTTYRVFPQESNQDIVDFYRERYGGKWRECDIYGLRHLPIHMAEAGCDDRLRELLLDFNWLQAKLDVTDVRAVLHDYDYVIEKDAEPRVVHEAIKRSAQVLQQDPAQLAGQLLGRLLARPEPAIQNLLDRAAHWRGALWLRPLTCSLIPPGDPLLFTLAGHECTVRTLAVTPDGRWGITAGNSSPDRTVRLWDLGTGTELHTFADQADDPRFNPVALTPDGRWALVAREGDIHVWDVATGEEVSVLHGHHGRITALAVADGGRRAISGAVDGSLVLWDLARLEPGTWQRAVLLPPQPAPQGEAAAEESIYQVTTTPDGAYAAALSSSAVMHWDLERRQLTAELPWNAGPFAWHTRPPLALQRTGQRAFYRSPLRIWDVEGGTSRPALSDRDPERVLAVAPDGEDGMIALVTPDGHRLEVWDIEEGTCRATLPSQGPESGIASLALTLDGRTAFVAHFDHYLRVWALERKAPSAAAAVPGDTVDITPDGRWAISVKGDAVVEIWDLETGNPLSEPAARQAVEGTFRAAWQERDARLRAAQALIDQRAGIRPAAESADKGPLDQPFSTSSESSGRRPEFISGIISPPKPVVAAANDTHAITYVSQTGKSSEAEESGSTRARSELKLWNLAASDSAPVELRGHSSPVKDVAMTPDGRLAASACVGRTVRVWDLERDQELPTLRGHRGIVWGVAVTPDGRRAVSASEDRSVRVWDPEHGTSVAVYTSDLPMRDCAVSDDGRAIAARDVLGRVHLLRLEARS